MTSYEDIDKFVTTTHDTVNALLEYKNGSDALALYFRYIQQRKMQNNNITKSNDNFMIEAMKNWTKERFRIAKQILIEKKMIEPVKRDGCHYMKINFIIHYENQESGNQESGNQESGNPYLNTLVENKNTLVENKNTLVENKTKENIFEGFYFSEKLQDLILSFIDNRKQIKKPMTKQAIKLLIKKISSVSEQVAIKGIETSIMNGYQGVFFEDKSNTTTCSVVFEKPEKETLLSFVRENSYKDSIADEAWIYFENTNWLDYRGNKITDWKRVVMDKYFKEWNKYKQPTTAEEFTAEADILGRGGMKKKYGEDGFYNIRMMPGFYYG